MNSPGVLSSRCFRLTVVVTLLFLFALESCAVAATLRGQIVRVYPNGARAVAGGIAVTVYNQELGRSSPAYSGPDGMYYLNVPAGSYVLEVWTYPGSSPITVQVFIREPYTDAAPVFVR